MKRAIFLLFVLILGAAGWAAWKFRDRWEGGWSGVIELRQRLRRPDPEGYEMAKSEAERWRKDLKKRYQAAATQEERQEVLKEASQFLESILPDMMACWMGTPWDFNGTAEGPGDAPIACGYFVATVLRDVGFQVDRYELAREASETMLRTFVPKQATVRRVGIDYAEFAKEVKGEKPGIRIVGLDTHVGFLIVGNGEFHFVHSSGSKPWCVVDEPEDRAEVLRRSQYRVHGPITGDPEIARRWVLGEPFRGAR
ncbi:hypothetical protein HNR46_000609 [Haloferula luteola]|uniref:Uncharacterized protein n=1 Tax=Haloferula luteola TaxID=595692 RepID=A0A840UXD2_9BACT|nr:hypothetical protein [Haloferula luteola]MBB5350385.1 hypothetical protein [Haloferula luteola]